MNWREKMIRLRHSRNLSQADLARLIGSRQQRIGKLEAESSSKLTIEEAFAIAHALSVSIEYLADDAQTEPTARSDDERAILQMVCDLGLDRAEAVRRLAREPLKPGFLKPAGEPIEVNMDGTPKQPRPRGAK